MFLRPIQSSWNELESLRLLKLQTERENLIELTVQDAVTIRKGCALLHYTIANANKTNVDIFYFS